MKVVVVANFDSMSAEVAKMVFGQITRKPNSVLGLATGSTPLGVYELLVEYHARGADFSRLTTFNLDEYVGLGPDHPQSYHWYMNENLFSKVNINPERTFIPDGLAPDLEAECQRYEKLIQQAGGIDLQLLGIGTNGHIGFNEPGTEFGIETHVVDLAESTIRDNARFFESIDEVPTRAISMGIKTIMQAKEVILMASGGSKADAVYAAVRGPVTTAVPASVLQLHPFATVVVDQAAASRL
ncbi:MAG: glucosamine-6-phosphate deaminase [Limnochordia bacterium]|jgi:glucosamine-6-phosphate deaminase|nr:glucosamine-6-phosphate deaminase [Bacillota bacterium]NLL07536.1 glucosamine-6-phosphate deaminase [Bacillota bacterium]HBG10486.1 glucosamine-6-phosphate deaminase [Bacillota bacterium]